MLPMLKVVGAPIVVAVAAASNAVTPKPGQKYLVVASVDCWINPTGAAAANAGIFVPAKTPLVLQFGDNLGAAATGTCVWGSGAGYLHLTPVAPA